MDADTITSKVKGVNADDEDDDNTTVMLMTLMIGKWIIIDHNDNDETAHYKS